MQLAALASLESAGANPGPTASVPAGLAFESAAGAGASGTQPAGEAPDGAFLSLLGMLLEEANPPAQSPASDSVSSEDPCARQGKDKSPAYDTSAERSKLIGLSQIPIAVIPPLPHPASSQRAKEPIAGSVAADLSTGVPFSMDEGTVHPNQAATAAPAEQTPRDDQPVTQSQNLKGVPPAALSGGDAAAPNLPGQELAFALRLDLATRADSAMPSLRSRDALHTRPAGIESRPVGEARTLQADAGTGSMDSRTDVKRPDFGNPAPATVDRPASGKAERSAQRASRAPEAATIEAAGQEDGREQRDDPVRRAGPSSGNKFPNDREPQPVGRTAKPSAPSDDARPAEIPRTVALVAAAGSGTEPLQAATRETRTTAVRSTEEVTAPESAPAATQVESAKRISLHVSAPESDRRVAIDLVERSGRLHVAVRSGDGELTTSLRQELGDLVSRLEQSGYGAETWSPADGKAAVRDNSTPIAGSEAGGNLRQDHPHRNAQAEPTPDHRERRSQPEWVDEIRPKKQGRGEETFLWHLQSIG